MRRMGRKELRALALLVALLLVILGHLPGLVRTNVEVSALDRYPDLRLEALATHFGARYSIPLMIGSVAPGADVLIDRSVPLDERVLLPDHLVAIGGARSVTMADLPAGAVPNGRSTARTHEVGWTMDVAMSDDTELDAPVVRVVPSEATERERVALHLDVVVGSGDPGASATVGERSDARPPSIAALRDAGIILGMLALGLVLMGRSGITAAGRISGTVLAILVGAAVVTVATGLLILAGAPTGRATTGSIAIAIALAHRRLSSGVSALTDVAAARHARLSVPVLALGAFGLGGIAALSAVLRNDGILTLTPDSITLLSQAELLATGSGAVASLAPEILAKRMLSVPAIHALGGPGAGPMVVLGPLLLLAIGVLTGAVAYRIAHRRFAALPAALAAAVAGSSVVAVERMLANSLYVNGHALVAAAVLGMLLIALDARLPLAMMGPLAALIALSRAEGVLLAALVLVGATLARPRGVEVAITRGPWLWLSAATVLRQTILLRAELASGSAAASTLGLLAVGVALAAAPLILSRGGHRRRLLFTAAGLLALWVTAVLAVLLDVGPARPSLRATITNVLGAGGWGPVLVLLGLAATFALLRATEDEFLPLAVPWLGFVPLGLLLAVLRDGAYRIGSGDSLNRMWIHLLPLLVLLIVLAVVGRAEPHMPADGRCSGRRERSAAPGGFGAGLSRTGATVLAFSALIGGTTLGLAASPTAQLTVPVTLPAALHHHEPVGELVAGSSFTHVLEPGLPLLLASEGAVGKPLCIELFAATYGGRQNRGAFAVEVVAPSVTAVDTVDMRGLRDNEWVLACPDGLRVRDLDGLRQSGVLRITGVDGLAGSSATVWVTRDLTTGTLEGGSSGIVHRFVTVEPRRRALPSTAGGIVLGVLLLAVARRPSVWSAAEAGGQLGQA